jgi:hypothetical protein
MLGNAIDLLFDSPDAEPLYNQFSKRLDKLERAASDIGWGYGDNVSVMIFDLKERMGEE